MTMEQTGRDPFAAHPDIQSTTATAPLNALQSRIMLLQAEKTYEEARLKAAERHIKENPLEVTDSMLDNYVKEDPRLREAQQRIWKIEGELSEIKSKSLLREKDRLYISKLAEKKRAEAILEGQRTELRGSVEKELKDEMTRMRNDSVQEMRDRLKDYDLQITALLETHSDELSKQKQFSGVTLDLELKRQELERSQDLVNKINDRIFALKHKSGAPARVEKLESASPPVAPVEATPTKRIVMAGGAAFMFPFMLAFLWELRLRRLSTVEQLEEAGRLPVLGETARFPGSLRERQPVGRYASWPRTANV